MNFSQAEYLPGSEERISRLRKIINGRVVAILAAGPSIKHLEGRIEELGKADICYFGLNNFFVQEEHILRRIDKRASVVMCSSREGMPESIAQITGFLDRKEENMFISSFWRDTFGLLGDGFVLSDFLRTYDPKLLFFGLSSEKNVPNSGLPLHLMLGNTLVAAIQLALIGKASGVLLFGADGHCGNNPAAYYYRPEEYDPQKWPGTDVNLINDTKRYFNPVAPVAVGNILTTYGLAPVPVLNCSERSFYTPFPVLSYDSAFDFLLNGKYSADRDLRVPALSVICSRVNSAQQLETAAGKAAKQSYSNYELLVPCGNIDGLREAAGRLPGVRLVPDTGAPGLKWFADAVSGARGEYVLYAGDGGLERDWANTCVEVLENEPEISLVCALPQGMPAGWRSGRCPLPVPAVEQARDYVYYWLAGGSVFPETGLCVRKRVLEKYFPFDSAEGSDLRGAWLDFNYRFNSSGYLPYFIPGGAGPEQEPSPRPAGKYRETVDAYRRQLMRGQASHRYSGPTGARSAEGFSRAWFIVSGLPSGARLLAGRTVNFLKRHGTGAFAALARKVCRKLMPQRN